MITSEKRKRANEKENKKCKDLCEMKLKKTSKSENEEKYLYFKNKMGERGERSEGETEKLRWRIFFYLMRNILIFFIFF